MQKQKVFDYFNFLDFQFNLHSFNSRKIAQKLIFILQEKYKLPINFNFTWFKHGPYSSQLTGVLYSSSLGSGDLSTVEVSSLNYAKSDLKNHLNDDLWFEVAASLYYISKEKSVEFDKAFEILVKRKPLISDKIKLENLDVRSYCRDAWFFVSS